MTKTAGRKGAAWPPNNSSAELPFELSIGYQIRSTHRALQRLLQLRIAPYGVTLGAWYFLRALWDQDGLTQRELADRSGTREPTALAAIKAMEMRGLVKRARSKEDRRKIHIWLTPKGKNIKRLLIPLAREVVAIAATDIDANDVRRLLKMLGEIQGSVNAAIDQAQAVASGDRGGRSREVRRAQS